MNLRKIDALKKNAISKSTKYAIVALVHWCVQFLKGISEFRGRFPIIFHNDQGLFDTT